MARSITGDRKRKEKTLEEMKVMPKSRRKWKKLTQQEPKSTPET